MDNWVENRRQEAFTLYGRYLAMGLHLRAGSEYDYTTYGGKIKASFANFVAKPDAVKRFIKINTRVPLDDFEKFLFANAKIEKDIGYIPIEAAINNHKAWVKAFGTRDDFFKTSIHQLRNHNPNPGGFVPPVETILKLIETGDEDLFEPIIALLYFNQHQFSNIVDQIKDNVIWMMYWNKMIKIRQLYFHLGILQ